MRSDKTPVGNQAKTPGWEAEYDLVRELLAQKFMRLRFPDRLEADLRERMLRRAVTTLRENYWMLFLLALATSLIILLQFSVAGHWIGPVEDLRVMVLIGLASGAIMLGLTLCGKAPALDRHYLFYVTPLSIALLVMLTVAPAFLLDETLRHSSTYVVIYALLILYGVSNMPLARAAWIGFGSMLVSGLIILLLDVRFDWGIFLQYFLLTNLVGLGNGYVLEVRERRLFLQSRLLELEKRQLNKLSERLVQLSREDGLTGLANRRHFNDTFLLEWERARRERHPLALVFADVDHFKAYNDNHGHIEGDRALAAVATVMQRVATRPGDLAARYGGEEFVLLLPNTDCNGAREVAEQLLHAVDAKALPHRASSVGKHVTISIGVAAIVPDVHIAPVQLIDRADTALYQAKEAGRHRVVVSDFC